MRISEPAKIPNRVEINGIPPKSSGLSKVNLKLPVNTSVPTVAINRPKAADIKPFSVDSFAMLEMVARPRIPKAKNSGGPNLRAIDAKRGAPRMRTIALNIPPRVDDTMANPMASAVLPDFDMGYPSRSVAAATGEPGIPKVMEVIAPP